MKKVSFTPERDSIRNIIKGHLSEYSNQKLCKESIEKLAAQIQETIEIYINSEKNVNSH